MRIFAAIVVLSSAGKDLAMAMLSQSGRVRMWTKAVAKAERADPDDDWIRRIVDALFFGVKVYAVIVLLGWL